MPANKKPEVYFGWYVVAAATCILFVTAGSRTIFGVFIIPMENEFGWSRFSISIAAGVGVLVSGVVQPFTGQIFDRTGGRKVILLSLIFVGLTTMLLSLTFHILFLIFVFGLVAGVLGSGASVTNTSALMARWFRRRRATAMGISATGLSLGGLIMVPLAWSFIEVAGWRVAWAAMGLVILTVVPLGLMFIRQSPAEIGLQPDGDPEEVKAVEEFTEQRRGPLEVESWAQSFRSLPIWQMSSSYLICGATTFILSVHFVPYAIDRGVSSGVAAMIFGLMSGLNIIGSIGAGMLSDRFDRKTVLGFVYLLRGGAYMVLILPPMLGVPVLSGDLGLWLFATMAGFSWVATAPLTTSLTADVYGLRALGTITGITLLFHQVGGFASVLFAGLLYDTTGSYTIPFLFAGSLLFPASISAFSIKERKYSVRYMAQPVPAAAAGN